MRQSIVHGLLRAFRSWQMVCLMLLASGLIAASPAVPIFNAVRLTTQRSLFADRMLADKADVVWVADYLNDRLSSLPASDTGTAGLLGLLALLATWVLQIFWTGGILHCFRDEHARFSLAEFFRGAALYYWRFFKLATVSAVAYGAVALGFVIVFSIVRAASDGSQESSAVLWEWTVLFLGLCATFVVSVLFDYVKISTVVSQSRKIVPEIAHGVRFAVKNFSRSASLAIVVTAAGLAAFGLLHWIRASIAQSSETRVWIAIVFGQLAIGGLIWKRLVLYAAEMDFFRRQAPVIPTPPPLSQLPAAEAIEEEPPVVLPIE